METYRKKQTHKKVLTMISEGFVITVQYPIAFNRAYLNPILKTLTGASTKLTILFAYIVLNVP